MSISILDLLEQVITEAKSRGISQKQLAEQAGLTPVGLSKAKKRGDIRASSLALLGLQVGLQLKFEPQRLPDRVEEAAKSGAFFGIGKDRQAD